MEEGGILLETLTGDRNFDRESIISTDGSFYSLYNPADGLLSEGEGEPD